MSDDVVTCPACGGSGGGPFGRPGSAWDVETFVCPRCRGAGHVALQAAVARPLAKSAPPVEPVAIERPGIADTRPTPRRKKRTSSG